MRGSSFGRLRWGVSVGGHVRASVLRVCVGSGFGAVVEGGARGRCVHGCHVGWWYGSWEAGGWETLILIRGVRSQQEGSQLTHVKVSVGNRASYSVAKMFGGLDDRYCAQ